MIHYLIRKRPIQEHSVKTICTITINIHSKYLSKEKVKFLKNKKSKKKNMEKHIYVTLSVPLINS